MATEIAKHVHLHAALAIAKQTARAASRVTTLRTLLVSDVVLYTALHAMLRTGALSVMMGMCTTALTEPAFGFPITSLNTISVLMGPSVCLPVILDFSFLPIILLAKPVLQVAAPAVMLILASLVLRAHMSLQPINAHCAMRLLMAVQPARFKAVMFGV
jgi:hypothetical protein